ncbi:MAG TPA: TetR family transcriptional regulator [Candidatus Dormibacteraeota bacterium]|nr:TetR family transcriptional regulator [Candidatus Dormibacteraeota bacterium]
MSDGDSGLRARKKLRTRKALIEAAVRLYREQGYDGVTVAAIAREADVAPRTFFGYFESKEDVFLDPGDERIEMLVQAIRQRDRNQPILAAVRPALLQERDPARRGHSSDPPDLTQLLQLPAVRARLRQRWNRWEDKLADAIAQDVGAEAGDPGPRVVAAALTGAIRVAAAASQEHPRRRRQIAERVFELLASGLSSYGAAEPADVEVPRVKRMRAVTRLA